MVMLSQSPAISIAYKRFPFQKGTLAFFSFHCPPYQSLEKTGIPGSALYLLPVI